MDIRFNCPRCGQHLTVEKQGAGMLVNCPSCNERIDIPRGIPAEVPKVSVPATTPPTLPPPIEQSRPLQATNQPTPQPERPIPYAVKVLTTKDRAFGGKFDPQKLEAGLNSYASQGWSLAGCDSAEFPGLLSGVRSELITVMHRIPGRMKKYKILTQKDRFFGGKFDPERLETAINSYAPEGWQVRAVTTATFPGFGSNREEMIILLEKEV